MCEQSVFSVREERSRGADVRDRNKVFSFSFKIRLHLDVICWPRCLFPQAECENACACVEAWAMRRRHLTNTLALCAFELLHIFWSRAFISTLLNVSTGKVSSFDALWSPLISQKCHPVVMAEAIPRCPKQICCANNTEPRKAESSALTTKWMTLTLGVIIRYLGTFSSSHEDEAPGWRDILIFPAAPSCGNYRKLCTAQYWAV